MRDMTIGQYYPVESQIHSLDPRTKMLGTLCFIIATFLIKNPLAYLPLLGIILILYGVSKVPFSYFLKGLKAIIVLLLITFFFRLIATPGITILHVWIFNITAEGLLKAIRLTSRIALMIIGASLLGYTTTPKMMADGLEKALRPLQKIGIPINDISVMVMITFRFIPVLLEEANNLMDAQAARGVEFEDCSALKKMKNILALLVPLFLSSVNRSAELAMAMEARGYSGEGENTKMFPLEYSGKDKVGYILELFFILSIVGLRIIGRV